MRSSLFGLLLICLLLCVATVSQAATSAILIDEDFEGSAPFVDNGFAVHDQTQSPVSVTPQGLFVRCQDVASSSPRPVITNTGTVVSERKFLGSKSLKLAAGAGTQSVISTGDIATKSAGEVRLFQFALGTDDATAAKADGTQVGHFKFDWSTDDTDTVQASLILNFVTNAGKVDVKCQNNSKVIGSLSPGKGNWLLISLLTNTRVSSASQAALPSSIWRAYDPLTTKYKGPQPVNPKADPATMTNADFLAVGAGTQIYVNDTNSTITTVQPNEIGAGWGNNNSTTDLVNSAEQGFQLVAENGGVLYIDDMYWDTGGRGNATEFYTQEQAARIDAFDQATIETNIAAAKTWDLY